MKKIVTLSLIFAIVLSFCACGGQGNKNQQSTLQVGFGRVDISPDIGVGMAGFGNNETRRVTGYLDYLYITCIAFQQDEETVLLYTVDVCSLNEKTQKEVLRHAVAPATGVPEGNILFSATHTHSGPQIESVDPLSKQYKSELGVYAVQAAKSALDDLAPATLYQSKINIEDRTFCRHYKLADGSYYGSNFGDPTVAEIVDYATQADDEMILVKFDRGDNKKDILLVNWQAHPDHAGSIGYTLVSADFPGAVRANLEENTDMFVAYFSGASGNLNPFTEIPGVNHNLTMQQYGQSLADAAIGALDTMTAVEGSGIAIQQIDLTLTVNHSKDNQFSNAQTAYNKWIAAKYDRKTGEQLAEEYGFSSIYEARAVVSNYSAPASETVELTAFRVGNLGFITANYEMFTEQGQYIKENSPFDTTIIGTAPSVYFPSEAAYEYNSYEAVSSKFEKGHAELAAQEYVRLLREIMPD